MPTTARGLVARITARGRTVTTAVAMSMATVLLLGACIGDGSTGPTPPTGLGTFSYTPGPEPSPTETPAPEAVQPDRPDAMDQDGVEGAEAAARYFLDLYPYVYATGDLVEWRRLSHPDCVFCTSVIDNATEMHEVDDYARGGAVTVHAITPEHLAGTRFAVEGRITQDATMRYDPSGNAVSEPTTPVTYDVVFALERTSTDWHVLEVDVVEVDSTT